MKVKIKSIILKIILCMGFCVVQGVGSFRFALIVSKNKDKTVRKYKLYYEMMSNWMGIIEKGNCLYDCFKTLGYRNIAIYGGRDIARHLIKQLQDTDICIKYIVDKAVYSGEFYGLSVYRPDAYLPDVDAIIVTPVWDYLEIKSQLGKKISFPVVSLEQIVREINNE